MIVCTAISARWLCLMCFIICLHVPSAFIISMSRHGIHVSASSQKCTLAIGGRSRAGLMRSVQRASLYRQSSSPDLRDKNLVRGGMFACKAVGGDEGMEALAKRLQAGLNSWSEAKDDALPPKNGSGKGGDKAKSSKATAQAASARPKAPAGGASGAQKSRGEMTVRVSATRAGKGGKTVTEIIGLESLPMEEAKVRSQQSMRLFSEPERKKVTKSLLVTRMSDWEVAQDFFGATFF